VKGIYPEETGWKETVRMNPLEDVLVAVRAKRPAMPFGLPHSYRALDPSQPLVDPVTGGAVITGFTQVNPITGNPAVVSNKMDDFMDEYVWHCHILGHEENDFMRPVKFDTKNVLAPTFTVTSATADATGKVTVAWVDPTVPATQVVNGVTSIVNSTGSEIGFRVERAAGNVAVGAAGFAAIGTPTKINAITNAVNAIANSTTLVDTTATPAVLPAAPVVTATLTGFVANVSWPAVPGATSYTVKRDGVIVATGAALTFTETLAGIGQTYSYTVEATAPGAVYSYRVAAVTSAGDTVSSNDVQTVALGGVTTPSAPATVTTPAYVLAQATGLAANLISSGSTLLTFNDASINETGYQVEVCYGTTTQCTAATPTSATQAFNVWYTVPAANVAVNSTPLTGAATAVVNMTMVPNNGTYKFRVSPVYGAVAPAVVGPVSASSPNLTFNGAARMAVVSGQTAVAAAGGTATVSWTDVANNNGGYTVNQRTVGALAGVNTVGTRVWTTAPTAVVSAPNLTAAQGGVRATVTVAVAAGKLVFTVTNPGVGYTAAPTITLTGGTFGVGTFAMLPQSNLPGNFWNTAYVAANIGATPLNGIATSATVTGLVVGRDYQFQVITNPIVNGGLVSAAQVTNAVVGQ